MTFVGCWSPFPEMARIVEESPGGDTLRTIRRITGSVTLVGHCLVSGDRLETAVDAMLSENDISFGDCWPGCYSLVLITRAGVTLLPDPVGQFPLFVAESGTAVWFGSGAADIARHIGATPDLTSLAITLVCRESWDLNADRSMFRGIRQAPEGCSVSIDSQGVAERMHHPLRTDPGAGLADSAERLRLALSEAVNVRMLRFSRPTADLSGGLDSTSLAFLAAPQVVELPVLTSYNPQAPVEDDLRHARSCVYELATTRIRQIEIPLTPEHLPYQAIGPPGDVPHGSSIAMGGLTSRLTVAAELGSDLHMVGEGGDVVLGSPLAYFGDLARQGEFTRLWRHCVAWARIRSRAPLALFARAMVIGATTRRRALYALAASLERGRPAGEPVWEANAIGYWSQPYGSWLTRTARRAVAARVRDTADRLRGDGLGVGEVVTLGRLRQQALTQQAVRDVGAELGVAVHAPFLDTAVVRACLSLSASRRADPAVAKPLLRTALSGLVPGSVLSRRTKGNYTRDAFQGVRRAAPVLRRLLVESSAADHGLVEPGPVREALEGAIEGLPTPWEPLNQFIAVEVWLRQQERGGVA